MKRFIITGTDTEIGKTIFSAALVGAMKAHYWKPVFAGMEEESDSQKVARLSGMGNDHIFPENYSLTLPASPHYAAQQDGIRIDAQDLTPPECDNHLIIEGAGGALVPINEECLYADIFARWQIPAIIVARTGLGTINHSLMTIEVLRSRNIPIHGIAFVGDAIADSQEIICKLGNVRRLGRLPMLDDLNPHSLAAAFNDNFNLSDFI